MENFLETNSNENSFFFLTLSNKNFKKCPAMEHCKNSLECFEYYTEIVSHLAFAYNVTSCIEKFPNSESYHLHILIDSQPKDEGYPGGLLYDFISYAEMHLEKFQHAEWKVSNDKFDNPTITYSPSFKLKIVNTIENKKEVINYIMKYNSKKQLIKDSLLNMLITRYCNIGNNYPKNRMAFMATKEYTSKRWEKYRDTWQNNVFIYIYINELNLDEFIIT